MGKRRRLVRMALLASLALAVLGICWWRGCVPWLPRPARTLPTTEPLAARADLVGEWDRVEFPEAVIPVNWRVFTAAGGFRVRYGDVIYDGTYLFVDDTTLETIDGYNGKVALWAVGRSGNKLVLVHQTLGWVEQYVRVPLGTVQPR